MLERLHLRGLQAARGVRLRPCQLPVLDVLGHRLLRLALLLAVGVDEGVGQDPVEPRLEVRAGLELVEGARRPWRRSPAPGPRRRPGCGSSAWPPSRAGPGTACASRSKRGCRSASRLGRGVDLGRVFGAEVDGGRGLGIGVSHCPPDYRSVRRPGFSSSGEHGHPSCFTASDQPRGNTSSVVSIPGDLAHHPLQRRLDARRPAPRPG